MSLFCNAKLGSATCFGCSARTAKKTLFIFLLFASVSFLALNISSANADTCVVKNKTNQAVSVRLFNSQAVSIPAMGEVSVDCPAESEKEYAITNKTFQEPGDFSQKLGRGEPCCKELGTRGFKYGLEKPVEDKSGKSIIGYVCDTTANCIGE